MAQGGGGSGDSLRLIVSEVAEVAHTQVEVAKDGDEAKCMLEGR